MNRIFNKKNISVIINKTGIMGGLIKKILILTDDGDKENSSEYLCCKKRWFYRLFIIHQSELNQKFKE